MAWVKITERFKWSPPERHNTWTQVYQPGVYCVTTACLKAAIDAGKGRRVPAVRKGEVADAAAEDDGVQG